MERGLTLSCVILKHASTACTYPLLGTVSEMAAGSTISMRKRCLFPRSQLITAAQSGSSWARFCSFRYESSSSRFNLLNNKRRWPKQVIGHDIRAFTFNHFSISSRFIVNETALLFFEIKLAITRIVVALVEAILSQNL